MRFAFALLSFAVLCRAQQAAATIEGTVVHAISGEGLKKAQVTANSGGTEPYTTLTDAAGHYVLNGLAPGSYMVSASRSGFINQVYGSSQLKIEAGSKLTGIDLKLQPQGVITGRVLDEDGDPVMNAMVQLVRQTYRVGGHKQFSAAQTSMTNDRGEYRIYGIPPGRYFVSATASSGRQVMNAGATYATVFYPSTLSAEAATRLEVTPGVELRGIDLTLLKTRTFRIHGRALDGEGQSLEDASVWMMPLQGLTMTSRRGSRVKGQGPGEFEFRDVPGGSYAIGGESSAGSTRLSGHTVVEVGDGNVDGVVLTLHQPASIGGKLTIEGNPGLDVRSLNVYLGSRDPGAVPPGRSQTEADGTFQLQTWPEAYDVIVNGLKENMYVKSVKFGDAEIPASGLDFTQGVTPGTLAIVVSPAGGQVDGTVFGDRDQAFSNALVALIPDTALRSKMDLFKLAHSDKNGRFSLRGIAPGEYQLLAWDEVEAGAWQDPDFLKLYESRAETVVLKEDSRENKQLHVMAGGATSPGGR